MAEAYGEQALVATGHGNSVEPNGGAGTATKWYTEGYQEFWRVPAVHSQRYRAAAVLASIVKIITI